MTFKSFVFLWMMGFSFSIQAQTPNLTNSNLVEVTPRIYALVGDMDVPNLHNQGFISNSVFVITNSSVVVVDPGGSRQIGEMVLSEIKQKTSLPVSHVISTHHHADHWMGNDAFAGLKPAPKLIGHRYMQQKAAEIGQQWLGIIGRLTGGANAGTRVVVPTENLPDGDTLQIGGLTFRFIHPEHAHTRGDLAIQVVEEKTLIAGDILFHKRTPGFQDASPRGNEKALTDMLSLPVEHVIPGHGPVTDKTGIREMLDYLKVLRSEVRKYFDKGLQDYEMKEKIDVGDYKNMSGFKDRFGINVNRMYLEIEEQSF